VADLSRPDLELTFEVASADATFALGERLGLLELGDFVGLIGELGAGKTLMVRGVARGAEVSEGQVSSPTFAIVNAYQGRVPVFHADLYRLADADELYATGFFDLLNEGAILVEWLDKVPEAAPGALLVLSFEVVDDNGRRIRAQAFGQRSCRLLEAWARG
jgi:tRNA threonylcarbamoyladenosine biosynthesis protein TsaE